MRVETLETIKLLVKMGGEEGLARLEKYSNPETLEEYLEAPQEFLEDYPHVLSERDGAEKLEKFMTDEYREYISRYETIYKDDILDSLLDHFELDDEQELLKNTETRAILTEMLNLRLGTMQNDW